MTPDHQAPSHFRKPRPYDPHYRTPLRPLILGFAGLAIAAAAIMFLKGG